MATEAQNRDAAFRSGFSVPGLAWDYLKFEYGWGGGRAKLWQQSMFGGMQWTGIPGLRGIGLGASRNLEVGAGVFNRAGVNFIKKSIEEHKPSSEIATIKSTLRESFSEIYDEIDCRKKQGLPLCPSDIDILQKKYDDDLLPFFCRCRQDNRFIPFIQNILRKERELQENGLSTWYHMLHGLIKQFLLDFSIFSHAFLLLNHTLYNLS